MAQSKSDLNPIEHWWRDLKIAVHQRSPTNLAELEQFSREEWAKISPSHCAKLLKTNPKRLIAVIAAKGSSTKYWPKGLNTFTTSEFWLVHSFCRYSWHVTPFTYNCLPWSLQLWIKKFIWKNCFCIIHIIHNSSQCGIIGRCEYFRRPLCSSDNSNCTQPKQTKC